MRNAIKLFILCCFALSLTLIAWAQKDSDGSFGELISHYYSNPQPSKVPAALENMLSSEYFKTGQMSKNNSDYISAYSFGRIAQLEPSLIEKYEEIFDKGDHNSRLFILKIFQVCGNDQVKEFLKTRLKDKRFSAEKEDITKALDHDMPIDFNPLTKQISGPNDLDFLWAEFLVSGNAQAVQKIISVLNWPDRAREKLQEYLKSSATIDKKKEIADTMLSNYNIRCNVVDQVIETKDDMDIIMASNLMQRKTPSELFQKVKEALKLNNDEIYYMATKGSANWSLNSNAQQHKKVFEICDGEISKYTGSAKIGLLKIATYGYLSMNENNKAADRLKQLIALNPVDDWAHFTLGSIYVENNDIENAKKELAILLNLNSEMANDLNKGIEYAVLDSLGVDSMPAVSEQGFDYNKIAKACVLRSDKVRSYESRFYIKDYENDKLKAKNFASVEWNLECETPDKFSVEQVSWAENVADRWITIGNKHYFQIGGWFEEPEEAGQTWNRNKTNEFLSLKKYIQIIKDNPIKSAATYKEGNKELVLLKYNLEESQKSQFNPPKGNVQTELNLWIDKSNNLIDKASLIVKGTDEKGQKIDLEFEQLFINYNKEFKIEKPKDVLNLGDMQKQ